MILITRLNGTQFYINAEMVQSVEQTPDTVITLTNNQKVVVKEAAKAVVERIIEYQRQVRGRGIQAEAGE